MPSSPGSASGLRITVCATAPAAPSAAPASAASTTRGARRSSTIIAELSESNSSNTAPMRFIAISDGASGELRPTLLSSPTSSSCGRNTLVHTAMSNHTNMIGTDHHRMAAEIRPDSVGASLRGPLIQTSPDSRYRRCVCSQFVRP